MYRNNFRRFLAELLAEKDHITWWMRPAAGNESLDSTVTNTFATRNAGELFLYRGGTDSSEKFTAEFSVSAPVLYKKPSPMGPEILYTTGAGKGVKVSVATFSGGFPDLCDASETL